MRLKTTCFHFGHGAIQVRASSAVERTQCCTYISKVLNWYINDIRSVCVNPATWCKQHWRRAHQVVRHVRRQQFEPRMWHLQNHRQGCSLYGGKPPRRTFCRSGGPSFFFSSLHLLVPVAASAVLSSSFTPMLQLPDSIKILFRSYGHNLTTRCYLGM
jgi:hypothetical protein